MRKKKRARDTRAKEEIEVEVVYAPNDNTEQTQDEIARILSEILKKACVKPE